MAVRCARTAEPAQIPVKMLEASVFQAAMEWPRKVQAGWVQSAGVVWAKVWERLGSDQSGSPHPNGEDQRPNSMPVCIPPSTVPTKQAAAPMPIAQV